MALFFLRFNLLQILSNTYPHNLGHRIQRQRLVPPPVNGQLNGDFRRFQMAVFFQKIFYTRSRQVKTDLVFVTGKPYQCR